MADAAEYRKARELWGTLLKIAAQRNDMGDHLTLDQHEPYAGFDHVLCASRAGEFWWDCAAIRRIAAEYGIGVDRG